MEELEHLNKKVKGVERRTEELTADDPQIKELVGPTGGSGR